MAISDGIDRNLNAFFSRRDLAGKTITIYSAGRLTQSILMSKKYPNYRISRIFDKNPTLHGTQIEQIPIASPQHIQELRNAIIIIVSTRGFPSIYLELKPVCDKLGIELLDISLEYSCEADPANFDFPALQANCSEQGLANAFAQTSSRNYLWHVAMPKSGSTWLTAVLENICRSKGWEVGRLFPYAGRRNFEIDPRYFFIDGCVDSSVFFHHQHCEYSDYTAYLVLRSRSKCIVQIRSVLDAAASLVDWYKYMLKTGHPDAITLPKNAAQWTDEYFINYVIDHNLPTYIRFAEGWLHSDLMSRGDLLTLVRFENLLTNPLDEVVRISRWANLKASQEEIKFALEAAGNADTKKNKGLVGRGRQLFSIQQLNKIENLVGYYFSNPDEIL